MIHVIFDMDGTLLDTQRICIPAWEHAGNNQGVSDMGACIPEVCGMNENGYTVYLKERFPSLDAEKFKQDVRTYILENSTVQYKKGAEELLCFLKEHHIKMAIASGSSRKSIIHHLTAVGAMDKFDALVDGKEVLSGKPAPDIFLLAAKRLGAKPSDCFVFEDSENGIRAGYAAGMKCIGVPDIVAFGKEVKQQMFAELTDLSEAIAILKQYLA